MNDHYPDRIERIVVDPAGLAGKPTVAGTRIPVSLILNLLANGHDSTRILQAYPRISGEDIEAAIAHCKRIDDVSASA